MVKCGRSKVLKVESYNILETLRKNQELPEESISEPLLLGSSERHQEPQGRGTPSQELYSFPSKIVERVQKEPS
jgi:hypothetical protein